MEERFECDLINILHNIAFVQEYEDPLSESSFNFQSIYAKDSYTDIPEKELNRHANCNEKIKTTSSIRKPIRTKRKYDKKKGFQSQFSKGKWNMFEEDRYFQFIKHFTAQHPSWNKLITNKKRMNYFKEMSAYVGTRNPDQCKSHDQKMRNKFASEDEFLRCTGESTISPEIAAVYKDRFGSEFSLEESPCTKESQSSPSSTQRSRFEGQESIRNDESYLDFSQWKPKSNKASDSICQEMSCMPIISSDQSSDELNSLVQIVRKRLLEIGNMLTN